MCCPPQKTESSAVKNAVPHPVSEKTGIELKGKIQKLGGFDEVYVVSLRLLPRLLADGVDGVG